MANFVLPYEPEYTAHRTDEQKHIETKKWLSYRIDELEHSPLIVPERPQFSSGSKVQGTEQPPPLPTISSSLPNAAFAAKRRFLL
jgi:hypothetical protein